MTHIKQVSRKEIIQTDKRKPPEAYHIQQVIRDMGDFYRTIATFYDNQLAFQVIRDSFF